MIKSIWACFPLLGLFFFFALQGCAASLPATPGKSHQVFTHLVPKAEIEAQSAQAYQSILAQAQAQKKLLPVTDPRSQRLQRIAQRIVQVAPVWSPTDAKRWRWEVNTIDENTLNAFAMPGGKIVFYTGLIDQLKLSDDEIAIIMGHEVAHALREHARENIGKNQITGTVLGIGSQLLTQTLGLGQVGQSLTETAASLGGQLLGMKFSRDHETDADQVGMDLAARAGYDPRAALSVWRKMQAANRNAPLEFFSTHPSTSNRLQVIEAYLPSVLPLYQKNKR